MLPRRTIEMIVDDCIKKYAREHDGSHGWSKEDIENMVLKHGGEQKDVYAAIAHGLEKCLGVEVEPVRNLMN